MKQGLNKVELDNYLAKELDKAGFTKSEIMKTPLVTRIVVNVTRPGLAIGKSGTNIAQLTETIGKRFGIDNPQLEIKEIERPELDAQAVANRFKALIERGFSWRSVIYKTLNDIQRAGAQGVEIVMSGKLSGKGGRKKRVRVAAGYMKKVGEQAKLVDYGISAAYPKVGAIGIKVRIVRPETQFPEKAKIADYIKKRDAAIEAGKQKEEKAEVKAEAAPEAEIKAEAMPEAAVAQVEGKAGAKAETKAEVKAGAAEAKAEKHGAAKRADEKAGKKKDAPEKKEAKHEVAEVKKEAAEARKAIAGEKA